MMFPEPRRTATGARARALIPTGILTQAPSADDKTFRNVVRPAPTGSRRSKDEKFAVSPPPPRKPPSPPPEPELLTVPSHGTVG